jgi:four helix bundle protein
MKHFKQLRIWQTGIEIALCCFKLTNSFPTDERYSLGNQIRRSAYSIPSNIAEGSSRSSQKDHLRFIEIAIGSAFELETQLILARNFYPDLSEKVNEVQILLTSEMKMLQTFSQKIKNDLVI